MSQSAQILEALQRGESLTTLEAALKYGVMALSQRVTPMIRAGLPIKSELVKLPNGKRVAKYSWLGQGDLGL